MKTRGAAVLVLALALAVLATGAVFLYVRSVQQRATGAVGETTVVVAKQDIPAGSKLDALVSEGAFTTMSVPEDTVIPGAVTSLSQLTGQTTAQPILEGEQITTLRLHGSAKEDLGGGVLGIPPGFTGVTFQLPVANAGGGSLRQGDHVTVFGSFDASGEGKATVKGNVSQNGNSFTGDATVSVSAVPGTVITIVPDTLVLRVTQAEQRSDSDMLVTLALKPQDSGRVVFAQQQGAVWLAVLPPNQAGVSTDPVTFTQVIR